jgi:hypothetical protein
MPSHPRSLNCPHYQSEYADDHDNTVAVSNPESHRSTTMNTVIPPWIESSHLGMNDSSSTHEVLDRDNLPSHLSSNLSSSSLQFHQTLHGVSIPGMCLFLLNVLVCIYLRPTETSIEGLIKWSESEYKAVGQHCVNTMRERPLIDLLSFSQFTRSLAIYDSRDNPFPNDHVHDAQACYPGPRTYSSKFALPAVSISAQVSNFPISHDDPHTIERLPSSDVRLVDSYLERQTVSGSKRWTCRYTGCDIPVSWKNKDAARTHIHKHLNETKLFKCVQWYVF